MLSWKLDEEGSVGAIPYAIISVIVFALIYLALGAAVDNLIVADNDLLDSGVPYSCQRADAYGVALLGFQVMPFIALLTLLAFLVQNGLQRQDTAIKPVLIPLLVSLIGMVISIVFIMSMGPVIDSFLVIAGSLDFTPWGQDLVQEPILFADWIYILIKIMVVGFAVYPFLFLFRRHEYQDIDRDPYMM